MTEEAIDPQIEGSRIVKKYLSELGWAKEFKRSVADQLIPAIEKDPKLRQGDQMEETADVNFTQEVDYLRKTNTEHAKEVLRVILKQLSRRNDLGFFAKRMIRKLKEEPAE